MRVRDATGRNNLKFQVMLRSESKRCYGHIYHISSQIAIYKDDFDNERRDREHTQTSKSNLQELVHKLQSDLSASKEEVHMAHKNSV